MFLPLPLPLIFLPLPLPLPSTLLKNIIFIVFALAPISPMLCHFFALALALYFTYERVK